KRSMVLRPSTRWGSLAINPGRDLSPSSQWTVLGAPWWAPNHSSACGVPSGSIPNRCGMAVRAPQTYGRTRFVSLCIRSPLSRLRTLAPLALRRGGAHLILSPGERIDDSTTSRQPQRSYWEVNHVPGHVNSTTSSPSSDDSSTQFPPHGGASSTKHEPETCSP